LSGNETTVEKKVAAPLTFNVQLSTSNTQHSKPVSMVGEGEPCLIQNPKSKIQNSAFGFTLLEVLVAVVLLATAFTIIWSTFSTTINGWRRSTEFLDRITHGDFVIDQMVSSLRSTAFFKNRPDKYGFWLDSKGGGDAPRDEISWVTSGTAFMLPEDPLAKGVYRIMLSVDDKGLEVRSFQHLKEELEKNDAEPWVVSPRVIGLDCQVYNFEEKDWDDEWEDTNAVPSLVKITLFMEPVEKYEPPVKLQRVVEIPIAPAVTGAVVVVGRDDQSQRVEQPTEQQPADGVPDSGRRDREPDDAPTIRVRSP
jgi:prepilin-type N-terminal cleavage/methylation domain-containing protein